MNDKILERMLDCFENTSQSSKDELNDLLETHSEERKTFITHLIDEEIMREVFRLEHVERVFALDKAPLVEVTPVETVKNKRWFQQLVAAAAVVAVLLAIGGAYQYYTNNEGSALPVVIESPNEVAPEWCAKLVDFSPDMLSSGVLHRDEVINPGAYTLQQGTWQIEFSNGVQMTVESPARFEIVNALEVILHQGKVRANVPEAGYGFVVHTADVKVRDLGTEFGVEVGEDNQIQVHVFQGEVELYEQQHEPVQVQEGFAAKWQRGERIGTMVANESRFQTGQHIAFQQWETHRKLLLSDPSMLAFYDFRGDGNNLQNTVSDKYPGVLHSPIRVRGRWMNQSALLFDSDDNWAEVDLPTVKGDFSLQTWVLVDRLESSINAIVNTKEWNESSLHWQLTRRGRLHVGVLGESSHNIYSKEKIPMGQWIQLTITFHSAQRKIKLYANDEMVSQAKRDISELVFGKTLLGCWELEGRLIRSFRGRMDELSLRSRCLSAEEIAESFKAGEPR